MGSKTVNYFDRRAASYLKKSNHGIWSLFRKNELQKIDKELCCKKKMTLLDLGSGPGYYSTYFHNKYGCQILGVDSSPKMVQAMKENGFTCILSSIENFKYEKKFDRILVAGVLEFIEKPEDLFSNLKLLLKKNGRIVIFFPKSGLTGFIYKAYHWNGCPTFIRTKKYYCKIAHNGGLKVLGPPLSTFLGNTISFSMNDFNPKNRTKKCN